MADQASYLELIWKQGLELLCGASINIQLETEVIDRFIAILGYNRINPMEYEQTQGIIFYFML